LKSLVVWGDLFKTLQSAKRYESPTQVVAVSVIEWVTGKA